MLFRAFNPQIVDKRILLNDLKSDFTLTLDYLKPSFEQLSPGWRERERERERERVSNNMHV